MENKIHLNDLKDTLEKVIIYFNETSEAIYELFKDGHLDFQDNSSKYIALILHNKYSIKINKNLSEEIDQTNFFRAVAPIELQQRCSNCLEMVELVRTLSINDGKKLECSLSDEMPKPPYVHRYIIDKDGILNATLNPLITINGGKIKKSSYWRLVELVNREMDRTILFDKEGNVLDKYKNKTLETFDLSKTNFKNKNLSYMDLSSNIQNLNIDFSNIQKSLIQTNLEGYNMDGIVLKEFDLTDANLKGTNASIDILTCRISKPEKLRGGTQFDETNDFYLGNRKLSSKEVSDIGIKIYRK